MLGPDRVRARGAESRKFNPIARPTVVKKTSSKTPTSTSSDATVDDVEKQNARFFRKARALYAIGGPASPASPASARDFSPPPSDYVFVPAEKRAAEDEPPRHAVKQAKHRRDETLSHAPIQSDLPAEAPLSEGERSGRLKAADDGRRIKPLPRRARAVAVIAQSSLYDSMWMAAPMVNGDAEGQMLAAAEEEDLLFVVCMPEEASGPSYDQFIISCVPDEDHDGAQETLPPVEEDPFFLEMGGTSYGLEAPPYPSVAAFYETATLYEPTDEPTPVVLGEAHADTGARSDSGPGWEQLELDLTYDVTLQHLRDLSLRGTEARASTSHIHGKAPLRSSGKPKSMRTKRADLAPYGRPGKNAETDLAVSSVLDPAEKKQKEVERILKRAKKGKRSKRTRLEESLATMDPCAAEGEEL